MRFTTFGPCLFWFLSGGVRGPMSIAHVFVISVPRSFDGLPRCDKTTSSKSWPSSRVAPIMLLVALAVRGFFSCSNAVLAFSALGLGPRFQSLFGWSWPRKEHVKIPPTLSIALGTWERIIGQVSRGMSRQVCCGSRAVHGEAAGYNISPAGHLDMFARGPESEFRHFSVFHMV